MSRGSFSTTVLADAEAVARAVAERIAGLSRAPGAEAVTIALSGGSTPRRLYEALAAPPLHDRVDWRRLELFFADERAVPPGHPESNWGMAERALLAKVPSVAHRMAAERGEAEAYERIVRERVKKRRGPLPAFDLILLGLGDDGHTASLFPGTAALAERARLVVMNEVPQQNTRRMTFTYPLLNAADRVWVLVTGVEKREIAARCLARRTPGDRAAPTDPSYPILGVEPTEGELVWWLDRAAAAR